MKLFLILGLIFSSKLSANNQFMTIISDIDDTVKMTALKGKKTAMLKYGPRSNAFYGLSDLYVRFLCHGSKNRTRCISERANRGILKSVIYVTGAPPLVQKLAVKFLDKNQFPFKPALLYKPRLRMHTKEFKESSIKKIVGVYPNKPYILIGDNGEYDPLAYAEVKKKFPDQIKQIFIHYVYSGNWNPIHKIPSDQTPYFTSVDLAIHFYNNGWIGYEDLLHFINGATEDLNKEDSHVVRKWMACKEFFNNNYFPLVKKQSKFLTEKINLFKKKISSHPRCK